VQLRWQPLTLRLRHPFGLAHGVSETRDNVLVYVEDRAAEVAGVGEAAAVPYHGETPEGIAQYLRGIRLEQVADPLQLEELITALPAGSAAARAALDIALHDAWGRALDQPLYRLWGLNPARIPPSSFTIPLGPLEQMSERVREAGSVILKLKLGSALGSESSALGSDPDAERVRALRALTSAPLRVDVNGGWTRERAARLLPLLAELGVELVEQPLPAGDLEGLAALSRLRERPPLFVDESIKSSADVLAHRGLVEGVVIKLAKSGGILAARQQINLARALGLEVMLGCMIESSVAVTAAAHLAPLAQYVDLDGPLLIQNDPFCGVRYERGQLHLPARAGLGLLPATSPALSPRP
jgi:L-alanine-DL-glutamate epimerase-like enolase superfamily enzyme